MKYRSMNLLWATVMLLTGGILAQDNESDDYSIWPREIQTAGARIVVYQPQPETLQNDVLEARAALSVTLSESKEPVFGAAWFQAHIDTDFEQRIVSLRSVKVSNVRFPVGESADIEKLINLLEAEIPKWDLTWSLDAMLASLEMKEQEINTQEQFNTAPPEIIFATNPSVLVLIDGEPIVEKIENSEIEYVANTAFLILRDKGWYYLYGQDKWYRVQNIADEWQHVDQPTESVRQIAELAKKNQEMESLPDSLRPDPNIIPRVLVRTKPAELIQTEGEPDFAPVQGTGLLYMKNTDNDVIMEIDGQMYYVLLSGRWYSAPSIKEGPWQLVPNDKLPADFAKIPAGSEIGNVRVSVAGTEESKNAMLENSVPQTAAVDRKTASLKVEYDGDPKFEKIKDTNMSYAVNTDKSVLKIGDTFYCCDDAVWFESAGPEGPWEVSTEVPGDIQSIPPEVPVYNVKYVYIYDHTPEVVYVGYTPGYVYSYPHYGCVVYGTGWYYRPWYGHYYYPRPVTWGFGVHYNPWTGWGFSYGVSYGWLHIGVGVWRPPYYGWWGPAGYRHGYRHGYHHGYRAGYYHGRRAGYAAGYKAGKRQANINNIYRQRPSGIKSTMDRKPSVAARPARDINGNRMQNNVFAEKNGNIVRRDNNQWQERKNGKWQGSDLSSRTPVTSDRRTGVGAANKAPSERQKTMEKAARDRQSGQQRTRDFQKTKSSRTPSQPASRPAGRRR